MCSSDLKMLSRLPFGSASSVCMVALPSMANAPTNAAFAMLGNATMHTLLADPNGNLDSILKYHIVPGIITEKKLNDENLGTIQRATINVHVGTHSTKINGVACVTETNILASNGVIHIIVSFVYSCFPLSKVAI